MEIRPGVHRIVAPLGDRFVALHLLVGSAGALLVDTGIRDSITGTFLPYLAANGIDPGSVRWAINTHCDYDHTGGNGALKAAIPGVELLVHALDRDFTEDVQALIDGRYGEFRAVDGFDDPPETTAYLRSVSDLVPVDRVVSGGEWIDLGDRRVQVLHVPGHSPGHIAVHDPDNATLVIGDATLGTTVPFADGRPAFPPTYRDVDPYLESIRTFRSLGATLLLTAHYPVYSDETVEGFLADSEAYTDQVDEAISGQLSAFGRPATTLELIRGAGARLGPWGPAALDYSIFPVTGALERMAREGTVRPVMIDGVRHWSRADAR